MFTRIYMYVTICGVSRPQWVLIDIKLMLAGGYQVLLLPEPMMAEILDAIWRHQASLVTIKQIQRNKVPINTWQGVLGTETLTKALSHPLLCVLTTRPWPIRQKRIGTNHMISHTRYVCKKVVGVFGCEDDIRNVNCVNSFRDIRGGTWTPNLQIYAECSNHLSYRCQPFRVT